MSKMGRISSARPLQYRRVFTSKSPATALMTINKLTLVLAAIGVTILSNAVLKIPIPNTHLPPNLVAKSPPGNGVTTYP